MPAAPRRYPCFPAPGPSWAGLSGNGTDVYKRQGFFDDGVAAGTENEYGRVLGTVEDLNAWKEPLSVVIAIASPCLLYTSRCV